MAKLSLVARPSKEDDAGTRPLYVRIYHNDATRYLSLGFRLHKRHWNAQREDVRKTHPDHPRLNEWLTNVRGACRSAVAEELALAGDTTASAIKERLDQQLNGSEKTNDNDSVQDFITFCENLIERYRERGQVGTAKSYGSALNKLKTFLSQHQTDTLSFSALTVSLLEKYHTWELNERGNAKRTANKTLAIIRTFCNEAIKTGLMQQDDYPFRHITLTQPRPSSHQWLRKEEIQRLAALEPRGVAEWARDVFLFQYYAWGMRFSDAFFLKWPNLRFTEDRIRYEMVKTGKAMDLPLTDDARRILERYDDRRGSSETVFPLADGYDLSTDEDRHRAKESRTARVNDRLQHLKEAADIPEKRKLTTHTARHSAACQMYLAWKDLYRIRRYLGHSSVTQTERYLRSMEGLQLGEEGDWEDVL